ncbi:MAG: D-alanine--D-alanine ligase [Gemmatimonadetes bacterium]|nr:D-alanine--D-alanine ligase [Gemmatimonadota bacterium]
MRIAIVHDDVAARPTSTPDELGVLEAVEAVDLALRKLGHEPVRVEVGPTLEGWIGRLADAAADLVFNLCEAVAGRSADEARVAAAIELLGLPTTGSPSDVLALALRKDRLYALLAAAGLPVPVWATADAPNAACWWRFPAIVKPAGEHASIGITSRSVAADPAQLRAALAAAAAHVPLLIQDFVGGRELTVGIVGDVVLPLAEIEFGPVPDGAWPVVSYEAKWAPGSADDLATTPRCPADVEPALADEARGLGLAAWRAVGGRGYGRVDLRAGDDGRLFILDVNPNPDLAPSAGLARMAAAAGWSYVELIRRIVAPPTGGAAAEAAP